MPREPRQPSYRLHKPSGKAVVTIDGRDYYLGEHGSPESRTAYDRKIAEWKANGKQVPVSPGTGKTVAQILAAYLAHAKLYYRQLDPDTGQLTPTPQIYRVKRALAAMALYNDTLADAFGPLSLKTIRQRLIDRNYARTEVNSLVNCIKRAWKWAVGEQLVLASVYHGLMSVEGLKFARTEARETEPVKPVDEAAIEAVRPVVLPIVRDLIDLQLLSAARPGELLRLRPADVDRTSAVWTYRPRTHKTRHHGHERVILFGPQAQQILATYLLRDSATYCFSPRDAMLSRLNGLGHKARTNAGQRYSVSAYVRAIRRGCLKAGVDPTWRPHQLRHNAATNISAEFGFDLARIILGHRTLSATRIYAEDNMKRAMDAMKRIG